MTEQEIIQKTTEAIVNGIKENKLLIITGCTMDKAWKKDNINLPRELPAKKVYKGPLFKQFLKLNEVIEDNGYNLDWYILSAKHGIIAPNQILTDYNVTFSKKFDKINNNYIDYADIQKEMEELLKDKPKDLTIVVWAGIEYCDRILKTVPDTYNILTPMSGLKIGVSLGVAKKIINKVSAGL